MTKGLRLAVFALVAVGLTGFALHLANSTAKAADNGVLLTGAVTSASGEKMTGVTVSAKAEGSTITTSVYTDGDGVFYFPRLAEGQYKVWAQAKGYDGGPFFSPDGEWIGYFADGALLKIRADGGTPVRLSEAPEARGGSWGDDSNIVFTPSLLSPLIQIPAGGGKTEPVTELKDGEVTHRWPQVLPGSDLILFMVDTQVGDFQHAEARLWSRKTHRAKTLRAGAMAPRYTASGHLMWVHDNVLFAAPINLSHMELTGDPVPILEDVVNDRLRGTGAFDASQSGTLVALTMKGSARGMGVFALEASGKTELLAGGLGAFMRVDRGGDQVLFATVENASRIVVYDPGLKRASVRDFGGSPTYREMWHPDGKHILFGTAPDNVFWARADGTGGASFLLDHALPESFSPDGRTLVFSRISPDTGSDIWTVKLNLSDPDHPKAGAPQPLIQTPDSESDGIVSPDGRWIAYHSATPGERSEVYVQPLPLTGVKWKISEGAWALSSIAWARDTHELFYLGADDRIMVVPYTVKDGSFYADRARPWSETRIDGSYLHAFDIFPDGRRAVVCLPAEQKDQPPAHLSFIVNFFDELRRVAH